MKTARDLTKDSAAWLAVLASNGASNPRPFVWEVAAYPDAPDRLLPLWLEPYIDYQTGRVVTARDPHGRLPSRPVRAHETVHWALTPLGATSSRCLGLEGLCDVGAALLTDDPMMAVPAVPGLTRDLRRPAFDATAAMSSQAHLQRVLQTLRQGSAISPDVLGQLTQMLDQIPDDDIQPHAFGVPFGHWLWNVLSPLPRATSLRTLTHAAAIPQLSPEAAVQAVVEALPPTAQRSSRYLAAHLGLIAGPQ